MRATTRRTPVTPGTPATPEPPDTPAGPGREGPVPAAFASARNIRWVLLGVMLAMLLGMLDNMIVGTAMPTIVGELGGLSLLSWVVSAYTLATAASTPLWGKLGDLYGRKQVFLTSIVVFLLGSGLSGAAQTMDQLIGFRVLQGIGAGGLAVGAFAIIGELVAPRERARYQGMMATVMALATVGGPLLGGFLTEHAGWRWAFYLNLPLGVVALVWCQAMLHLSKRRADVRIDAVRIDAVRIDYLGAVLLTVTITAVVLMTTWGGTQYAWGSDRVLVTIVVAVLGLAAFLWSQARASEPVLPLGLFRNRNVSLSAFLALVTGVAMFGAVSFLPLFQQTVQGASAANSGLLLLPMMIPIILVSQIVGRVMAATGRYKVFPILGAGLLSVGSFLLSTTDTSTGRLTAGLFMAVFGAGLGFLMQMVVMIAQNSAELKDMGAVSGAATLFRTLGGSAGVALFGALFNRRVSAGMAGQPGGATAHGDQLDPSALGTLPDGVRHAYLHAVSSGIDSIFLCCGLLCAAGFVAAWFIQEIPLRGRPGAGPGGPAKDASGVAAR
ncbi:MDR family MFS transporter [Streptacidiphilus sp. EB129]|uniref:MDR family MFS transporter n=1 Tax=Streptacidiphilus sp. EB129 TaxID=3156262 RepID=UPI00351844EA